MKKTFLNRDALFCMFISLVLFFLLYLIAPKIHVSSLNLYRIAFEEFSFLDLYYTEKMNSSNTSINSKIILVNIEHRNRKELAILTKKIQEQQPKVVGVDVIFKENKDVILDEFLKENLIKSNTISTYAIVDENVLVNHDEFIFPKNQKGYSNFNFNRENSVIRNFEGIRKDSGETQYSFAAQIAKTYLGNKWKSSLENKLSKKNPINYRGNYKSYFTFEYNEVIKSDSLPIMNNAIVLLGYMGEPLGNEMDIEDKHFTPLNKRLMGKSAPDTYGVVIHANIVDMIISNNFFRIVPRWLTVLIGGFFAFFALKFFIVLGTKSLAGYVLIRKYVQLAFSILFIFIALILLRFEIYFKITEIIWYVLLSIESIGIYKLVSKYLYNKFLWKSTFYQE